MPLPIRPGQPPGMPPPGLAAPPGMPPPGPPPPGVDPGMGDPGMGMDPSMGMPPPPSPFPSADPQAVAQLMGLVGDQQQQDHQQLDAMQADAITGAADLIQMMRDMGNPAAQAAVTTPGYPTPPPPAGNY